MAPADHSSEELVRSCLVATLPARRPLHELALSWQASDQLVFLDSADTADGRARWSILGAEPFLIFHSKRHACFAGPPGQERALEGAPLDELARLLRRYALAADEPLDAEARALPFRGGALGYLSYELLYLLERVPDTGLDDRSVPDSYLMFCDTVVIDDAETGRTYVVANGFAPAHDEARAQAARRLTAILARIDATPRDPDAPPAARPLPHRPLTEGDLAAQGIVPVLSEEDYVAIVERAKEHIRAGDVFELCTCNRYETRFAGAGHALYRALRRVNPAPFSAYLKLPMLEVLSSSPERFLRLGRDGWAETSPIKGTRPRGGTPAEDARLRRELASSEKDRAENLMIVDLARSDLGRVCEAGSVTVTSLQEVHTFAFVHQMISTIRGRVREDARPVDLLRAAFPGGSMTGAPKIESMKLIDALEPVKRGVFSGSIGYFDFEGAFDLSIVIRTFVRRGDLLSFHVGGAVVVDSNAREEHQELLDKAAGLVAALEAVDDG